MPQTIVLASQSPRRRELLRNAGIPHIVRPSDIDESRIPGESPRRYVNRLAAEKAGAANPSEGEIVLAADTVVVVDGEIFGKPEDTDDARRMLCALSGRDHVVITGICLVGGDESIIDDEETRVHVLPLEDEDIAAYIASGEPMDKAGAYGIQGLFSKYVERIDGCYFNVVGLPVSLVWKHLSRIGPGLTA